MIWSSPLSNMLKSRVETEIISMCPKDKDQILQTVEQVKLAMTADIPIYEKYNFPECLSMEVGISAGDNWGQTMSIEKYLDTF